MKSLVTELQVCIWDRRHYITGYKVDMKDDLPKEVMQYLYPQNGYLNPSQMYYMLACLEDTKGGKNGAFDHKFIWYSYTEDIEYPNLALNGILATRYNIPIKTVDIDNIYDTSSKNAWLAYLDKCQEDFFLTYPESIGKLVAYSYATTVEYSSIKEYLIKDEEPKKVEVAKFEEPVKSSKQIELEVDEDKEWEERRKRETTLVPPPFSYDRGQNRLVIPRRVESVNFPLVKHLLQAIQLEYGITFDAKMIRDYHTAVNTEFDNAKSTLEHMYNVPEINFNARKCGENHYAFQLCKFVGEDYRKYVKSNGYMSFKKEHLLELASTAEEKRRRGEYSEEQYKCIMLNQKAYQQNTNKKLISEIFEGLSPYNGRSEFKPEENSVVFHCMVSETETKRFTTQCPNLQGKTADIKKMIKTRAPGRKVVALDIKAQEVVILIFGILENKVLQRLALEYGDCYQAIAVYLGFDYNPEIKSLIKVPILSIMNGKAEVTIRKEMMEHTALTVEERADFAEKIFHLIYDDPGYKRIYELAKIESKKAQPIRRGLFGTEKLATKGGAYGFDAGTKRRQAINANFQLTAAEILTMSLHAMLYDLLTKQNKYGLSIEQLTPVVTIYDEVVFDVDEKVLDEAIELIKFYMLPMIQGWTELKGELTQGDHYVPK